MGSYISSNTDVGAPPLTYKSVYQMYTEAMQRQRDEEERIRILYGKYMYKTQGPKMVPQFTNLSTQGAFEAPVTQENRLTTLDVYPDNVTPRKVLVPHPFRNEPKTVFEALRRGRKVLEDEARWVKGSEHPINGGATCSIDSKQSEDPFCGSWQACARGAVSLVTRGLVRTTSGSGHIYWKAAEDAALLKSDAKARRANELYQAAEKLLDLAVVARNGHSGVVSLNDDDVTTRTEVLEIFDVAMKMSTTHANAFLSHMVAGGLRAA